MIWNVIYEIGYFLGSLFSRIVNTLIFKGSMYQTLSARAHVSARTSAKWKRWEWVINKLIFWQEDHCKSAWEGEVYRARNTLARNEAL